MHFDIITIFPEIFNSFLKESLLAKAQEKKIIKINIHNLRKWAGGKHQVVDDSPYGGGPGMVVRADIIARAISKIKNKKSKSRTILFSPVGKKFTQKDAQRLSKYNQLVFTCGRYEGVDYRVEKYMADEIFSVGDYVLSGGEIPAMIVVEAVSRLVKGVLGKEESIEEKRYGVGVPVYTRPEAVIIKGKKRAVPKVLLSGDHKKIAEWRRAQIKNPSAR